MRQTFATGIINAVFVAIEVYVTDVTDKSVAIRTVWDKSLELLDRLIRVTETEVTS